MPPSSGILTGRGLHHPAGRGLRLPKKGQGYWAQWSKDWLKEKPRQGTLAPRTWTAECVVRQPGDPSIYFSCRPWPRLFQPLCEISCLAQRR